MSVHQSVWTWIVRLPFCSRPSSRKHHGERSGRRGWGCAGSWHCLPVPELLGGCGAAVVMTAAPWPPTDGAVLGTEEGTTSLKPGQCLSAARRQEKAAKSWFPGGEALQQHSCSGSAPAPIASRRPAGPRLALGQGRRVSVSCPLLPARRTARSCVPSLLSPRLGCSQPRRGSLAAVPLGAKPPVSSSRGRWEQFDKKYLSQLLMRKSAYRLRDEIWDVYYKLNIRDAISFVDQVGTSGRTVGTGRWDGPGRSRVPSGQAAGDPPYTRLGPRCQPCPSTSQGGHVLSAAKLALPSMPSRTSMSESSVTNLL